MRFAENKARYSWVKFMVATENLMKNMTVQEFIEYLQVHGELEEEDYDTMYIDKQFIRYRTWMLREVGSNLRKEFAVTEDGRIFWLLSLADKVELVDEEV